MWKGKRIGGRSAGTGREGRGRRYCTDVPMRLGGKGLQSRDKLPGFQAHQPTPPSSSPPARESSFVTCHVSELRQPEDVTRSIIHLRYLRGQSLEAINISPNRVIELLVDVLGIQLEMRLGDARQDIEEMAVLCHELLKSTRLDLVRDAWPSYFNRSNPRGRHAFGRQVRSSQ
jgi:hypothetical protein